MRNNNSKTKNEKRRLYIRKNVRHGYQPNKIQAYDALTLPPLAQNEPKENTKIYTSQTKAKIDEEEPHLTLGIL